MAARRRAAARALLAAALAACAGAARAQRCRMDPSTAHSACGLPQELSNFQARHECAPAVKIGRPVSVAQAAALVASFSKVRASGVGHSWNEAQFCAGDGGDAVNVVMTEVAPVLDFIQNPVAPEALRGRPLPPDFPIRVDEERETVTVAAGVPQRMLLDFLAEYRFGANPDGWTLPAFSWFIDQTIGGAVVGWPTGTHGSSFRFGSLSSQLKSLRLIVANGTLLDIDPRTMPHLWRAAGVSAGRLGAIAEVTLRIVPQRAVRRSLADTDFATLARAVKGVQDEYVEAVAAGDERGARAALSRLDETQAFWHVATAAVWRTDYERLDREPLAVLLNVEAAADSGRVAAMNGPGVYDQADKAPVGPNRGMTSNARWWANFYMTNMRGVVTPGTFEARRAYVSMAEGAARAAAPLAPYDQYEVAVPLEAAGDCLAAVGAELYGPAALWEGFRSPLLVRFVSGEEFYLSNSHGGPRMYINLEDYIGPSSGRVNDKFQRVVALFRERCGARLHWGKAGWDAHAKCFDGAKEYPDSWCDFGCAARQLDPTAKFAGAGAGAAAVWRWAATRGGAPAPDFGACCGPDGFNRAACRCASPPC